MEESFSRRQLISPQELRDLNRRSDMMGGLQMASHWAAIAGFGYLHYLALGTHYVWLTGFCLGVTINFLYAAQHELSHWTVFRTPWLNMLFGRLIGFLMLFPRDYDMIMHYAHHRWTQDWERDGELVREPFTLGSFILWMLGVSYWRNRVSGMIRRARGIIIEGYIRPEEEAQVTLESRLHLLGYAAIFGVSLYLQTWAVAIFWLAPMILTKPVHQLQNTIEHLGLTHNSDILENTRSTRTNAVMRWLCWQMPYHTAHHTFPSVPFWKLRQLNDRIESVAGEVHRMGWIEFQIEVIRRLMEKDESQWPMNEVWVVPRRGGRAHRLPAEG